MSKQKAVFLDRDGTIIVDRNYLSDASQITWLEGCQRALRQAVDAGYVLVVVTNQSGVARGLIQMDELELIHREMQEQLEEAVQVRIHQFYVCPHHEQGVVKALQLRCDCRKPGRALFDQAILDWNIDVTNSIAIGDRVRDLIPAAACGVQQLYLFESDQDSQVEIEEALKLLESIKKVKSWTEINFDWM